ncbi:TPA: type IV pilus modification PilV family protein [Escherichia coli]
MKRQNGIMLLEVAIFLVLLSLGYLSWMSVRKNVEQYDFSMQVARSLCYQQDMLSVYIKRKKDSLPITTGNEGLTAIPFDLLNDVIPLIDNKTPLKYSYYMVNNSNSSQSNINPKDKLQKYIQTSKVKAIVVLSVKNGKVPEYLRKYLAASLGIFGAIPVSDNNIISLRNDFFDVSVLEHHMKGKIELDDVIAVALIPEIPSPYQTCFYGAQYNE